MSKTKKFASRLQTEAGALDMLTSQLQIDLIEAYQHFLYYNNMGTFLKAMFDVPEEDCSWNHAQEKYEWYLTMKKGESNMRAVIEFIQYMVIRDKARMKRFIAYLKAHHWCKW